MVGDVGWWWVWRGGSYTRCSRLVRGRSTGTLPSGSTEAGGGRLRASPRVLGRLLRGEWCGDQDLYCGSFHSTGEEQCVLNNMCNMLVSSSNMGIYFWNWSRYFKVRVVAKVWKVAITENSVPKNLSTAIYRPKSENQTGTRFRTFYKMTTSATNCLETA